MKTYITLDYELFLGNRTGTPEKCLIEPMKQLTEMLDKQGIKLNVFVDATYLLQLEKLKGNYPQLQHDYDAVVGNIKQLESSGHSIQLHIHPQWCYSNYDGVKWILDKEHYKMSDLVLDKQRRLIIDCVDCLNRIVSHKVTAFRAGGYSVENFPELYDTFIADGIKYDTSAIRGDFAVGKYHAYDYRVLPLKTSYKFSSNHKVEDENGGMMEYPISTKVVSSISYLINKHTAAKKYKTIKASKQKWGDGEGIGYPGTKIQILFTRLKMLFGNKPITASIEGSWNIEEVFAYSKMKYKGDDFVIIGHPKLLSPFSIAVFEQFINNHPEMTYGVF